MRGLQVTTFFRSMTGLGPALLPYGRATPHTVHAFCAFLASGSAQTVVSPSNQRYDRRKAPISGAMNLKTSLQAPWLHHGDEEAHLARRGMSSRLLCAAAIQLGSFAAYVCLCVGMCMYVGAIGHTELTREEAHRDTKHNTLKKVKQEPDVPSSLVTLWMLLPWCFE